MYEMLRLTCGSKGVGGDVAQSAKAALLQISFSGTQGYVVAIPKGSQ